MVCISSFFFFSSRRRHTRCGRDWSSDVCSSDLDGAGLADELVHPLVREGAVAVAVDVGPVRLAGWLPVEQDAEPHRGCWCCWSHDQVEVAGVEAAGDLPVRRVERDGLLL